MGLFGLAAIYIWPTTKSIGFGALAVALLLTLFWSYREIVSFRTGWHFQWPIGRNEDAPATASQTSHAITETMAANEARRFLNDSPEIFVMRMLIGGRRAQFDEIQEHLGLSFDRLTLALENLRRLDFVRTNGDSRRRLRVVPTWWLTDRGRSLLDRRNLLR